jgi:hypothetical protein
MAYFRESIDMIVYTALVGVSILIFMVVSEIWGMVFAGCLILGIGFSVLMKTPGLIAGLKYPKLISFLSQYAIIREDQIRKKFPWAEDRLHRALFELSKAWQTGPLVVFVKRQYLYVSQKITPQIQAMLVNTVDNGAPSREIVKNIGDRFPFKTRAEIDAVIERLRANLTE